MFLIKRVYESFEKPMILLLHFSECTRYHINYSKMLKDLYIAPLIQKIPATIFMQRLLNNKVFQHGGINACLLDMSACFLNSDPLLIHRGTVFRRQWDWNARVIFLLSAQNCLSKETQIMHTIRAIISTWHILLYQCASIQFTIQ